MFKYFEGLGLVRFEKEEVQQLYEHFRDDSYGDEGKQCVHIATYGIPQTDGTNWDEFSVGPLYHGTHVRSITNLLYEGSARTSSCWPWTEYTNPGLYTSPRYYDVVGYCTPAQIHQFENVPLDAPFSTYAKAIRDNECGIYTRIILVYQARCPPGKERSTAAFKQHIYELPEEQLRLRKILLLSGMNFKTKTRYGIYRYTPEVLDQTGRYPGRADAHGILTDMMEPIKWQFKV